MRLRNVKHAGEMIAMYPNIIIGTPTDFKGKWNECFGNNNPIEIEIGCGKGKFIQEIASRQPEKNFIGIEKFDSVIIRALEKVIEYPLPNLRLIRIDADKLPEIFDTLEISKIYLNFSDPWPKKRTAKRRLTSTQFLDRYSRILKQGSNIIMKTDNSELFEFSKIEFNESQYFDLDVINNDLYSNMPDDNIQTEFEQKFVEKGNKIFYLKATFKGDKHEEDL